LGNTVRRMIWPGQRAQAETVNSMLKRNLGDALRARSPKARKAEQMLRIITLNIRPPPSIASDCTHIAAEF